jgi:hypothetical protein
MKDQPGKHIAVLLIDMFAIHTDKCNANRFKLAFFERAYTVFGQT